MGVRYIKKSPLIDNILGMKNALLISRTVILSLLLFISCNKDDIDSKINMLDTSDYFPLNIGDYHKLDFTPKRTIEKVVEIDGIEYFQQNSDYDTLFYRKTSDGKIYQKTKIQNEVLKFDLNAETGTSWNYKFDGSELIWNATLTSKNETIKVDNYTFENCYEFYYDIPQLADEEHIIRLAPGVGIVEEVYLGGSADRIIIREVKIHGVEIQF